MRIRRLPAPAVAGAVLTAFFAALTACSSGGPGAAGTQQPGVIDVSGSQCGGTWSVPGPGWHTIQISNQGTGGAEIDLVDPANGAVYAEVENTGPGTVTPMSLDFGSGTYAFICQFSDSNPHGRRDGHGARAREGHAARSSPSRTTRRSRTPRSTRPTTEAGAQGARRGDGARSPPPCSGGDLAAAQARLADGPPAVRDARRGVRHVRRLRRRDRRPGGRRRGRPARSGPASTGWSTGCGTGSPPGVARRPSPRALDKDVERAARLVADAADTARPTSGGAPTRSSRTRWSSSSPGTTTTAAAPRSRPRSPTSPPRRVLLGAAAPAARARAIPGCPPSTPG